MEKSQLSVILIGKNVPCLDFECMSRNICWEAFAKLLKGFFPAEGLLAPWERQAGEFQPFSFGSASIVVCRTWSIENQQSYIRVSCLATKMSQAFPLRKERPAKEDTLIPLIYVKPILHLHPVEELYIIRERVVGLSRGCISSAWSSWGEILMVGFYGSSAVSVWLMIIP